MVRNESVKVNEVHGNCQCLTSLKGINSLQNFYGRIISIGKNSFMKGRCVSSFKFKCPTINKGQFSLGSIGLLVGDV